MCLKYLVGIIQDGQRLSVFIDEFDSEMLTESERIILGWWIRQHFSDTFLVISTQSLRKYRSFKARKSRASMKISTHHFENLENSMITIIELGKITVCGFLLISWSSAT